MADGLRSSVRAEFLKSKLRDEVTQQREGNDNPNNVYIREDLTNCALTNLHPNHYLEPADVFIVGYMKSGTTWFRNRGKPDLWLIHRMCRFRWYGNSF